MLDRKISPLWFALLGLVIVAIGFLFSGRANLILTNGGYFCIAAGCFMFIKQLIAGRKKYYAIYSPLIGKLIGVCADCREEVLAEEPGSKFIPISEQEFDTFGDDPGQWTQLDQIWDEGRIRKALEKIGEK